MPKIAAEDKTPKALRPYQFHGLDVDWGGSGSNAKADCPFCAAEGKFSVNVDDGLWRCFSCDLGGNVYTFLRQLWESAPADEVAMRGLAKERGLLGTEALLAWGVRQSPLTGEWLVPGFGADGGLNNLYRWARPAPGKKPVLISTADLHAQLFAAVPGEGTTSLLDPRKLEIYVAEGPWDGMALWEALRLAKPDGGLAAGEGVSMAAGASVVAVPGCKTFQESWLPLFAGKKVALLYDNDHLKERPPGSGRWFADGIDGMHKVAGILTEADPAPSEVRFLNWRNAEGVPTPDTSLPSGFDVRDALKQGISVTGRINLLEGLLKRLSPVPEAWLEEGRERVKARQGRAEMNCLPCRTWAELVQAWRLALHWGEGLDRALSVMLAVVTSTKAVGDQLWATILSPPSTGKSILCEALSVCRKYILPKDTMTGLFSGFQMDADATEDFSLAAKVKDKTLVIKEGDTILQAPNRAQILSQFRAFYDRSVRTSFKNKASRDYEGMNATVILCGTGSLAQMDTSDLGHRFVTCRIMDDIDEDLEEEIMWRVANRSERCMAFESDGKLETQHDPDLARAMQLTGGYVDWLRSGARDLLAAVRSPEAEMRRCVHLGKFVAYMRARPSTTQDEVAEREYGPRLVSQFVRLAKCLAVVLNKRVLDAEVMRRVTRCAVDTGRGRVMEVCRHLAAADERGLTLHAIGVYTNETPEKSGQLCRFLRRIGALEMHVETVGIAGHKRWRMSPRLTELWREVMTDA